MLAYPEYNLISNFLAHKPVKLTDSFILSLSKFIETLILKIMQTQETSGNIRKHKTAVWARKVTATMDNIHAATFEKQAPGLLKQHV